MPIDLLLHRDPSDRMLRVLLLLVLFLLLGPIPSPAYHFHLGRRAASENITV